jgi:hypothetical protein
MISLFSIGTAISFDRTGNSPEKTRNSPILRGALAIEYRWLCFCQNESTGADQFRTGTVRKAAGFFAFKKSFISYHNSPILASKLSRMAV